MTPMTPQTGAIAWALIWHPFEDPGCRGKLRPVLLIEREEGHWWLVGLTTNPRFRNGRSRVSIPDPFAVGLDKPGYLWGDRLTSASAIDIQDVTGWCDPDLAEAVITHVALNPRQRTALRQAAQLNPPPAPAAAA